MAPRRTISVSDMEEPVDSSILQYILYYQYVAIVLIGCLYDLLDFMKDVVAGTKKVCYSGSR